MQTSETSFHEEGNEGLLSATFEVEDCTPKSSPQKVKKIRWVPVFKGLAYVTLVAIVAIVAFAAGWASSWVTNDTINNKLHEGSWIQSPVDDVKEKRYESVMEIGNSELQVIKSISPEHNPEWGGIKRDEIRSNNITFFDEELGDRTVLKDPVTKKPVFYIDREYVRDLAFGQIVDETGSVTDESFRFKITDAVTGDVAEIVPMSISLKDNFGAVEEDNSLSAGENPTFYFEWNKDKRAILQANAKEGDLDLLWPKDTKDVEKMNSFISRFVELYEPFIEAENAISFDESDYFVPESEEVYYDDGVFKTRNPSQGMIKRTEVNVRGNILSAWFQPKNCWVTYCRPIQVKKYIVTNSRSKCGAWLSFGRWIIKTVSKRCYECPRKDNKCNGLLPTDPEVCSEHGECKRGKCYCRDGFAGNNCQTCSCRVDSSSYPNCDVCEPKYGGKNCLGCADGYWPSPLCWLKRLCHGVYFDNNRVCSGHGDCASGISLLGKCTCHKGWAGSKCNKCANNFRGNNCDECKPGFAGENCDVPITCDGFAPGDPLACNQHGECRIEDPSKTEGICVCDDGYSGDSCETQDVKCYNVDSTNPSVCSGNGTCVSTDNCRCNRENYGNECQNTFHCDNVAITSPSVCGGVNQGECVIHTDKQDASCVCKPGWSGDSCTTPKCNGKPSTDQNVCSGHGDCEGVDNCNCSEDYFGNNCERPRTCGGVKFTDIENVCSGHGPCVGNTENGTCSCQPEYSGDLCQYPVCYDVPSTQDNVCSGQGSCNAPDQCTCNRGYIGSNCETQVTCDGLSIDDNNVCSGNGDCVDVDKCSCKPGFEGENCERCVNKKAEFSKRCNSCLPKYDNATFPSCSGCKSGFDPSKDCDVCKDGFFLVGDECRECHCDSEGSKSSSCNQFGVCECNVGYTGDKCTSCDAVHYPDANGDCVECGCNAQGTIDGSLSCYEGICDCKPGFSNNKCDVKRSCFGKEFDDPTVCSQRGQCTANDVCSCSDNNWAGDQCQLPVCKNIPKGGQGVCNGRGDCTEPNRCTCEPNYFGDDCEVALKCGNHTYDSGNVCSGHGICEKVGEKRIGECKCGDRFDGFNCEKCKNIRTEGPNCDICIAGFKGENCDSCADGFFEVDSGNCENCFCDEEGSVSNSCNSGVCSCKSGFKSEKCDEQCECSTPGSNSTSCDQLTGQCECKDGFSGIVCQNKRTCGNIDFDDSTVCGGNGECIANDECRCKPGFSGPNCSPSAPICFGIRGDVEGVCSGNGICTATDTCVCNPHFAGKDCRVEMKFPEGKLEHFFQITTGRYEFAHGPDLTPGETFEWKFEVLATGYWPGQEGFVYGVAAYPLVDLTFHELGRYAEEWGYRGRNGHTYVGGRQIPLGGKTVSSIGDQVKLEMITSTGTLNVYVKKVGESEFTLAGGRSAFQDVYPTEGRLLRPVVAGICYMECGVKFIE